MRVVVAVDTEVCDDPRAIGIARNVRDAGHEVIMVGLGKQLPQHLEGVDVRLVETQRMFRLPEWLTITPEQVAHFKYRRQSAKTTRQKLKVLAKRPLVSVQCRLTRLYESKPEVAEKLEDAYQKRLSRKSCDWQSRDPVAAALVRDLVPEIVAAKPDLIHAQNYRVLPVAIAAATQLQQAGRAVQVVYDANDYWPEGLAPDPDIRQAAAQIEREYAARCNGIMTASHQVAQGIAHRLRVAEPTVVLNASETSGLKHVGPGLRQRLGLAAGVPLVVTSLQQTETDRLSVFLQALTELTEVHLVVVVDSPSNAPSRDLADAAKKLGIEQRVHLTRPVTPKATADFLAEATLGLIPPAESDSSPSLPTAFFTYLTAGLPLVAADSSPTGKAIVEKGIGAVFSPEEPASVARAIRDALENLPGLTAQVSDSELGKVSWEAQREALYELYRRVTAATWEPQETPQKAPLESSKSRMPGTRLAVMPANSAGQGHAWATAAATLPDVSAVNYATVRETYLTFPATYEMTRHQRVDPEWVESLYEELAESYTHVLLEAGWDPPELSYQPAEVAAAVARLEQSGVKVGMVFHGSEVRIPSVHAQLCPYSNLADADDPYIQVLEIRARTTAETAKWLGIPLYCSTPDLADYVPATWLPLVINVDKYQSVKQKLVAPVPLVVHSPSNQKLKGSKAILEVLSKLAEEKLIRLWLVQNVPPEKMPDVFKAADIVVDQIGINSYGVAATEAMAAGCLTLAQIGDDTRSHIPGLPIVEADEGSLDSVMREILANLDEYCAVAERGPKFVREWHDGKASARALQGFLESAGA